MNWTSGEVDMSAATSLMAHNGRVVDLSKGTKQGPSHDYLEKIEFENSIQRHDLSVIVEYDGCRVGSIFCNLQATIYS